MLWGFSRHVLYCDNGAEQCKALLSQRWALSSERLWSRFSARRVLRRFLVQSRPVKPCFENCFVVRPGRGWFAEHRSYLIVVTAVYNSCLIATTAALPCQRRTRKL